MVKNIKRIFYLITVLIIIAIIKPISSKALTYYELYTEKQDGQYKYFKKDNIPLSRNTFLAYGKSSQSTIGIPQSYGGSDWGYVENNAGIWCLNHIANKTGARMYIQDVITITGDSVTSDRYSSRKDKNDDPYTAAMFAYAIRFQSTYNSGFKGGHWTYFYNNWRTSKNNPFYQNNSAIGIIFKPTYGAFTLSGSNTVNGISMTQDQYANSIKKLYKSGNFSCSETSELKQLSTDQKDSLGTSWDYLISGIQLEWSWGNELVNKRQITIDGTTYNVNLKKVNNNNVWYIYNSKNKIVGRVVRTSNDKNGYIYLKSAVINTKLKQHTIKFTETDAIIWSRMYLIGGDTQQTRAVSRGAEIKQKREISSKIKFVDNSADVSIQKFVTGASSTDPTTAIRKFKGGKVAYVGNYNNNRINKTAIKGENLRISTDNTATDDKLKYDNPVTIYPNYYVTYKVIVYNNKQNKDLSVTIKDLITTNADLISVFRANAATNFKNEEIKLSKPTKDKEGKHYEYVIKYKTSSDRDVFLLTYKFSGYTTTKYVNKAWVYELKNQSNKSIENTSKYRQKDYDYVQMPEYKVSLQKYITKVENSQINGRENKPVYTNNSYKKDHPVTVKAGNKIEYTIKVKNDGAYTTTIPTLIDTLPDGLTYKSFAGDATKVTNSGKNLIISLKNSKGIEKGKTLTIKIYATVNAGVKVNSMLTNQALIKNNAIKIGDATGTSITDTTLKDNKDEDYIKITGEGTKEPDVSLQKYITSIKNSDGKVENYNDSRSGYISSSTETDKNAKKDVTASIKMKTTYKLDNKFRISEGAEVTYKIVVYNNSSDIDGANVVVTDRIPDKASIIKITRDTDGNDIKANWTKQFNEYSYIINKLNRNSSTTFYITLKFSGISTGSQTLENSAFLEKGGNYRTVDRDYVYYENEVIRKYAVSLEKYVSEVTDKDGNDKVTYDSNRKGKPIYGSNGTYKNQNKVTVELDDLVTYKIIVKNDGDQDTIISKVEDVLDSGLEFKQISSSKGTINYSNGTIILNNVKLTPGETMTITLKVQVKANREIPNTAEIKEIKNSSGAVVEDTTPNDNKDSDFLKMSDSIYKVSLEKYVSEVTDIDGNDKVTYDGDRKGKPIYGSNGTYKEQNKVEVDVGDLVTYKIIVKNDGDQNVLISKVEDILDEGLEFKEISSSRGTASYSNGIITLNNIKLTPGATVTITLKVKVKTNKEIPNTAEIKEIKNTSGTVVEDTTPDDNKDSDFINTDENSYKVSLEKFVSRVSDTYGSNAENYDSDRKGRPIYGADGTYKEQNPVLVEIGDIVSYDIIVRNDGEKKIKLSKIEDKLDSNLEFKGFSEDSKSLVTDYSNGIITLNDPIIESGESITITLNVSVKAINVNTIIVNTAEIKTIKNRNSEIVEDTTPDDNKDSDFIKGKIYKVSLEKYISKINDQDLNSNQTEVTQRVGKQIYRDSETKYKNPVTISKGDVIEYTITVKNDGENSNEYGEVKITKILDNLSGYIGGKLDEGKKDLINEIKENLKDQTIGIQETAGFTITYKVNENNLSLDILTNIAQITEIKNRNDVTVEDTTPDDNKDADYAQMKDIEISGKVWNDKPLDKKEDGVNGKHDKEETTMEGIKVYLYREGDEKEVASTTTSNEGKYTFKPNDLSDKVIKGPKAEGTSRWAGIYHNYYVVFEYDGITYTSTIFADITSNDENDSNAKEDGEKVKETRQAFNDRFAVINNSSNIEYDRKNEDKIIPQSIFIHNEATMSIQSSTNKIKLSNSKELEAQLKHVNLGLKNRDVFDLELISDVASTEVTVNGRTAKYEYKNKVTVRGEDVTNFKYVDTDGHSQPFRETDFKHNSYKSTGLGIKVTYRITIANRSQTIGKATRIVDYYDSKYEKGTSAYYINGNGEKVVLDTKNVETNSEKFNAVEVNTKDTPEISRNGKTEIYLELTLKDAQSTLQVLTGENAKENIATYNMAEVFEYTTKSENNDIYMQGLIDRDSAPGSANTDKVSLRDNEKFGEISTVEYYFENKNLDKLKYEDDTYTAPVLYFVKDTTPREITGTVFKDNGTTRGKNDTGDHKISGATVQLIETVNKEKGAEADGNTVIYETTTDDNGGFTIKGFLPGEHIIRYFYGNNEKTLITTDENNKPDSYNGYLYKSTDYKVPSKENYWYLDLDGSSIAKDDETRRAEVNAYTQVLNNEKTTILNSFYTKPYSEIENTLGKNTKMFADTANMIFEVEKEINSKQFNEKYDLTELNFGIINRADTNIEIEKTVKEVNIVDSTGKNTLASIEYDNGAVKTKVGDILAPNGESTVDVSMQDKLLQGAKMTVTYSITVNTNEEHTKVTKFVDYIPNNLSYNPELGDNKDNWQIVSDKNSLKAYLSDSKENILNEYNTIVEATSNNNVLKDNGGTQTITLETVLSSTESTIEQIIASSQELIYEYVNKVETYETYSRDSYVVKTKNSKGELVLTTIGRTSEDPENPDSTDPTVPLETTSTEITIHPPTGSEGLSITYYVVGAVALIILASGIVLIKKYALRKE